MFLFGNITFSDEKPTDIYLGKIVFNQCGNDEGGHQAVLRTVLCSHFLIKRLILFAAGLCSRAQNEKK